MQKKKNMKFNKPCLNTWEMQIKTTFIYNFSLKKLAKIQKFANTFCRQSCREIITLIHCWWDGKWHNLNGRESDNSYLNYLNQQSYMIQIHMHKYKMTHKVFFSLKKMFINSKRLEITLAPSKNIFTACENLAFFMIYNTYYVSNFHLSPMRSSCYRLFI